jgi:hypothetical protein
MTTANNLKRIEKLETAFVPTPPKICFTGSTQESFDEQLAAYGPTNGLEVMNIWLIGVEPKHDTETQIATN